MKNCPMCSLEIPAAAKKCPHCHHYQSRGAMLLFHPGFAACIAMIPAFLILLGLGTMFRGGADFQEHAREVKVTESTIEFSEFKGVPNIVVIGTVTNGTDVLWENVRFHVEFFDGTGKRTDVGQKEEYSFAIPPNTSIPFKVTFRREFDATNYIKHTVRILSAEDATKPF